MPSETVARAPSKIADKFMPIMAVMLAVAALGCDVALSMAAPAGAEPGLHRQTLGP
jgi:hypothetical protein